jgi:excisionase family DNA binding protein
MLRIPGECEMRQRLLSVAEAAEQLSASTKTVRRRIADGTLTGYRMGPRLIRVDQNELEALLRPIPTAGQGSGGAAA